MWLRKVATEEDAAWGEAWCRGGRFRSSQSESIIHLVLI